MWYDFTTGAAGEYSTPSSGKLSPTETDALSPSACADGSGLRVCRPAPPALPNFLNGYPRTARSSHHSADGSGTSVSCSVLGSSTMDECGGGCSIHGRDSEPAGALRVVPDDCGRLDGDDDGRASRGRSNGGAGWSRNPVSENRRCDFDGPAGRKARA